MGWYAVDPAEVESHEWDAFVAYCETRGIDPEDPEAIVWYDAYVSSRVDEYDGGDW